MTIILTSTALMVKVCSTSIVMTTNALNIHRTYDEGLLNLHRNYDDYHRRLLLSTSIYFVTRVRGNPAEKDRRARRGQIEG